MPTVYFVCVGNSCRSPMAAEIFNQIVRLRGIGGIKADSFGIEPFYRDGEDIKRLRELAVQSTMGWVNGLTKHRPKGIGDIVFEEGDCIILLDGRKTREFVAQVRGNPSYRGKRLRLGVVETEDPYGGSVDDYIACCLFLKEGIKENLNALLGITCS